MRTLSKLGRLTAETLSGEVDTGRLARLLGDGWQIAHDRGTAFVSLRHPAGGALSLLEVKTYGTDFTTREADEIAAVVADLLQQHFST